MSVKRMMGNGISETEFLTALKTVLSANSNVGVNIYVHEIYGNECVNHDLIVNSGLNNNGLKVFQLNEIDKAIEEFWNPIQKFYSK